MIFIISYIIINIFIGSRMRALGNIMHECSHNICLYTPMRNKILGSLIAILLFDCFDIYKKNHVLHHRYLGNKQKDPDYIYYIKIKSNMFQNNNLNVLISVLNPYNWYLSLRHICLISAKNKYVVLLKIFYLLILIIIFYFWPKPMLLYFLIPFVTSYQLVRLFSDIVDHDNVYENPLIEDRASNHIFSWKILNWLVFPRNDAYHLVHHLYPKMPVSKYKTQHSLLLKKNSAYASKNHSCDLQKFVRSGIQK